MKTLKNKSLVIISREWRTVVCGVGLSLAFSLTSYAAVFCGGSPVSSIVVASSSAVAEAGGASAQFIFRLGGAVGGDTHLTLQISGTAANGEIIC